MRENIEKTIDIDNILKSKMGSKAKYVPSFASAWLKHIVHQDQVNEFLHSARDLKGVPWLDELREKRTCHRRTTESSTPLSPTTPSGASTAWR